MGKKGGTKSLKVKERKRSKKTDKSKEGQPDKGLNVEPHLLAELNKDLQDCFRFKNGDVYIGQYHVTPEGGIVRHGKGRYFSADNQTYCGTWESDILKEADRINYPDGSWYQGRLEDGGYVDKGKYCIPQMGELDCTFSLKRPLGLVTLTDIDGAIWQGQTGEHSVKLLARNNFFDSEDKYFKTQAEAVKSSSFGKSSIDIAAEKSAEEAARAARKANAAELEAKEAAVELAAAQRAATEAAALATAAQAAAEKLAAKVEESRTAAKTAATRADVAKTKAAIASAKAAEIAAESTTAKLMHKTSVSKRKSDISEMRME